MSWWTLEVKFNPEAPISHSLWMEMRSMPFDRTFEDGLVDILNSTCLFVG